jgi:4a-hydroxytetrahydrobiopterin dehydratase
MARDLLDRDTLARELARIGGWRLSADGAAIEREFNFASFGEAFAFMTRAAMLAERLNHHPDWRNVYRRVEVRLSTHDRGGVTELDIRMAEGINRMVSGRIIASD